jgi:hypothetical protein
MIVVVVDTTTPPKAPVMILAASNVLKESDNVQNNVPIMKPEKKKSSTLFLSNLSMNPAKTMPDIAALKI